jgi:flavodoxin
MKVAIRYFTIGGNTEKLAKKIGELLNIPVIDVYEPLKEDVDLLFLCSSVYAAGVDDKVKEFINNINVKVGQVINISTAALLPSTYKQVSKLLAKKNIPMSPEEFHCRGSFGPFHAGHPNEKDLNDLEEFIKKGFGNYVNQIEGEKYEKGN